MKFLWDKPSSFCQNHVEKSWTQFTYTLHIFHLGERVHPGRCEFSLVTRVMATCLHVFNTRLWQDPQPYFFIHVTEIQCYFKTAHRMCLFVVNSWEHSEELIWSTQSLCIIFTAVHHPAVMISYHVFIDTIFTTHNQTHIKRILNNDKVMRSMRLSSIYPVCLSSIVRAYMLNITLRKVL